MTPTKLARVVLSAIGAAVLGTSLLATIDLRTLAIAEDVSRPIFDHFLTGFSLTGVS